MLQLAGERRKAVIRRHRADHDRVQIGRLEAGAIERDLTRLGPDLDQRFSGRKHEALRDPGTRANPLVRRVHPSFEVVIGN
jgi:hypothetical protein